MSNTLYEIDHIVIDLEKTFDNSTSIEIDKALFRDKIMYMNTRQFIIEIPYIKGTNYFFSEDFYSYTYNQCDIDTLLMMGLIKTISDNTRKLLDYAINQNKIVNELRQ